MTAVLSGLTVRTRKYLQGLVLTCPPGLGVGSCGPLKSTEHVPNDTFVRRTWVLRLRAAPCHTVLPLYLWYCQGLVSLSNGIPVTISGIVFGADAGSVDELDG